MRASQALLVGFILLVGLIVLRKAHVSQPPQGDIVQSITVGGYRRQYIVHVPANVRRPAPLVFFFHGLGGDAAGSARNYEWDAKADANGFIVVYPQGLPVRPDEPARLLGNPNMWRQGAFAGQGDGIDDAAFFSALLSTIESQYEIDRRRVYVTGFSNGAGMTMRLGAHFSSEIAAIAPDACEFTDPPATIARPLPVYFIIGTADPLVPVGGGTSKLFGRSRDEPPIQETIDTWARLDGCPPQPESVSRTATTVTRVYGPGAGGVTVTYEQLIGVGHHWSGAHEELPQFIVGPALDPIDATDTIWNFFSNKALP